MRDQNKKKPTKKSATEEGARTRIKILCVAKIYFDMFSNFARSFTGPKANGNKFSKLKATSMRLTPSQKHINLSLNFLYFSLPFVLLSEINGMVK